MVSSYTSSLRITQQGNGDNNSTWGDILNTQLSLVDSAISGMTTVTVTGDVTLTTNNGSADEARAATLKLTGTPSTSNSNVIVPATTKLYHVYNTFSGSSKFVTIKTASGTGVALETGQNAVLLCNGVDVVAIYIQESGIPSHGIILWQGSIATIPSGWYLCDGNNGTPNLVDRFIVGAKQDDGGVAKTNITGSLTQSGGSLTTSSDGAISAGTTGSTALTVNQLPKHKFTLPNNQPTTGPGGYPSIGGRSTVPSDSSNYTNELGNDETHNHTTPAVAAHAHTSTPPYYALAFIMKA